ncbi:MAG TPA: MarR family transcriptional regulator [Candidatus Limnocylindrales bacterium]
MDPQDRRSNDETEPFGAPARRSVRQSLDGVLRSLRRTNLRASVFGQSIAIRLGLSDSDVEALETLIDTGAATAGRLAELMGLTTGAVTRLVDRLEQAGYVRRVADPGDRRRVIIEVVPEKAAAIEAMFASLGAEAAEEVARYTDSQLELINDFLTRMADVTREQAERLREYESSGSGEPARGEHAAPVGDLDQARLLFRSGASNLTLRGGSGLTDLYRARFEGAVPRVTVRDGTVSVQYRGFGWGGRPKAEVDLNTAVAWRIEVQGGASSVAGRLEEVPLRGVEVVGGASDLDLVVGRPTGHVPIRIVGGASKLRLSRPAGVAVRAVVSGGVGRIEVDGQRMAAQGGNTTLESPGAARAEDRYEVQIVGGAGRLTIERRD